MQVTTELIIHLQHSFELQGSLALGLCPGLHSSLREMQGQE